MSADALEQLDDVLDGSLGVEQAFFAQLAAQPPEHRRVLVAALRSACGEDQRRRLAARGMDDDEVRASVARMVRALLSA